MILCLERYSNEKKNQKLNTSYLIIKQSQYSNNTYTPVYACLQMCMRVGTSAYACAFACLRQRGDEGKSERRKKKKQEVRKTDNPQKTNGRREGETRDPSQRLKLEGKNNSPFYLASLIITLITHK